jgi:geranylgeranyl diphosphate synthase, type II
LPALELEEYLAQRRQLVDKALDEALPGEDNEPFILHRAMRYSVFAGGKRIRPVLAMTAADAVGGAAKDVLPLAVALECVHTYSLIHDDLPAMDNDDLRRGKPTAHKVFGEAVAILAGDALLTQAFAVLGSPEAQRCCRGDRLVSVIRELAFACGSRRLVAGQVMDIMSEGCDVDCRTVDSIIRNKTAALIRASLICGGLVAGGSREEIEILGRLGGDLGAVFQIKDDLLDLEGDPEKLGKAVRKDQKRGKATYPRLLGKGKAESLMNELIGSALEAIRPLGEKGATLSLICKYIGDRTI